MKKILKLLFCFLTFFLVNHNVLAEESYIYLGDVIPDIRLYLKTPMVEKYKNMYEIINQTTGEHVYCIEPGVVLKDGIFGAYQYLDMIPEDLGITEDEWNYLRTIAYYGYGYQDRTDIKWYAATQFIIWDYLLKDTGEIYFVDSNNQKIDLLQEEIDTIQFDVDHHNLMPSFLEQDEIIDVELGDTLTFIDEYGILDAFEMDYTNVEVKREGNEVTLTFLDPGYQTVGFWRHLDKLKTPRIFYSPSNQSVMAKGIISRPYKQLKFNVDFPTLTLTKKGNEDSLLSLAGAKYGIYYEDGVHYQTIETNEDGIAYLEEIHLGKYYLQEIAAPYGYEVNDEKIYFEVTQDDIVLESTDKLIKKEIVIEKYLEDIDGNLELEKNAKFQVYDKNGDLYTEFITNEYGKFTLVLPYGKYTLKQITSTEGYHLAEDITLIVGEDTDANLIIRNPQIVGSLLIEKKDSDTKELIDSEASFKIYNTDTNEFFEVDGNVIFKTKEGILSITNIPYGNYELIEVEAPDGYQILEEKISFAILSEEAIELEITNQLQNGVLQIEKLDYDNLKPLQGVLFGLYNQDKELISEYETDENGMITISNLLAGLYYIKELNAPANYELLNGFMEVNIQNNVLSNLKITNRLKIEVPKTSVNELLGIILFTSVSLFGGVALYRHDKKH